MMPQMPAGVRSTEFWLVATLLVLIILNGPLSLGLSSHELLSMAIGVAGYSGSRGLAKAQAPAPVIAPGATVVAAETVAVPPKPAPPPP
jgi:hypothetical protein